ncbi:hypothetical protein HFO29_04995 [Rhizobium laguerreae]|nr:hypothetical protein [Rhizobium laguerreae]
MRMFLQLALALAFYSPAFAEQDFPSTPEQRHLLADYMHKHFAYPDTIKQAEISGMHTYDNGVSVVCAKYSVVIGKTERVRVPQRAVMFEVIDGGSNMEMTTSSGCEKEYFKYIPFPEAEHRRGFNN